MAREPESVPSGCGKLKTRNYPTGIVTIVSLFLFFGAVRVSFPSIFSMILENPLEVVSIYTSHEGRYVITGIAVFAFAVMPEIHEQTHRLTAIALKLKPTYRRWIPFQGGGYVLIQETWITRRESNIMTASTILILNPLLFGAAVILPAGIPTVLLKTMFVFNSSMMAKDAIDVAYNLMLPRDSLMWVSDLGEEPVEYYVVPEDN